MEQKPNHKMDASTSAPVGIKMYNILSLFYHSVTKILRHWLVTTISTAILIMWTTNLLFYSSCALFSFKILEAAPGLGVTGGDMKQFPYSGQYSPIFKRYIFCVLTPVHVDIVEEPATSTFRVKEIVSGMVNWKGQMGNWYRTKSVVGVKVRQSHYRPWGFQEVEDPRFQDNRHIKIVKLSALRTGRL